HRESGFIQAGVRRLQEFPEAVREMEATISFLGPPERSHLRVALRRDSLHFVGRDVRYPPALVAQGEHVPFPPLPYELFVQLPDFGAGRGMPERVKTPIGYGASAEGG